MNKKLIIFTIFVLATTIAMSQPCISQEDPSSDTICYGVSTTLHLAPASGDGTGIAYLWQQSTDNSLWQTVEEGDSISPDYTTPPLTSSMYYRRSVTASCDAGYDTIYSDAALITVRPFSSVSQKPAGQTTLCQKEEMLTQYTTTAPGATSYDWKIVPDSAGKILGNSDTIFVLWNQNFYGTVYLKTKAHTQCSTSEDFNDSLEITITKTPEIQFIESPTPVCGNSKGLVYVVKPSDNENYYYLWDIDSKKGEIVESNQTKATVNWYATTAATTGIITAKVSVDNSFQCAYTCAYEVAISSENAPSKLNGIVAKKDKNKTPYMLIYPNPTENFIYQWYKNDSLIAGATEQFFYPPNYNQTLEKGAEYKVYVSEARSVACGSFTEVYTLPAQSSQSQSGYFTLLPNPVSDGRFTVSFNQDLLPDNPINCMLSIYSATGEKVWEQQVLCLDDVHISKTLTAGVYMITLTVDGKRYSEKLLIR